MNSNSICQLLNIKYPLIQGGMVWVSGGKLAAACSNAGALGIIGAGSMNPSLLDQHIKKAQSLAPGKSLAVNFPLIYSKIEEQFEVALKNNIKIFFTSAGSPKKYTKELKKAGVIVVHVTAHPQLAQKCEAAGVDAVVAEGFEAGGHNGREEITTMSLIPQVVNNVKIPVIAAGGIVTGKQMAAAFCLGASAVQMGTRFLMTKESSAHLNYKNLLLNAKADDTTLTLKELIPVRLFKNKFFQDYLELKSKSSDVEKIKNHLGKGRAKKGMLEGDLDEGELEVGQAISLIDDLPTVEQCVQNIIEDFKTVALQSFYQGWDEN